MATAKQIIAQLNQQPIQNVNNSPKPIFVIRTPSGVSDVDMDKLRKGIAKDKLADDYHVLVVPSQYTDYGFEMYNADKIEKREWNKLVNQILK